MQSISIFTGDRWRILPGRYNEAHAKRIIAAYGDCGIPARINQPRQEA